MIAPESLCPWANSLRNQRQPLKVVADLILRDYVGVTGGIPGGGGGV